MYATGVRRVHGVPEQVAARALGQVWIARLKRQVSGIEGQDAASIDQPDIGAVRLNEVEHTFDVERGVDLAQIGLKHTERTAPPGLRNAIELVRGDGRCRAEQRCARVALNRQKWPPVGSIDIFLQTLPQISSKHCTCGYACQGASIAGASVSPRGALTAAALRRSTGRTTRARRAPARAPRGAGATAARRTRPASAAGSRSPGDPSAGRRGRRW